VQPYLTDHYRQKVTVGFCVSAAERGQMNSSLSNPVDIYPQSKLVHVALDEADKLQECTREQQMTPVTLHQIRVKE
jgi:hypothetical protein